MAVVVGTRANTLDQFNGGDLNVTFRCWGQDSAGQFGTAR
jgi:hypothetical protein